MQRTGSRKRRLLKRILNIYFLHIVRKKVSLLHLYTNSAISVQTLSENPFL